MTTTQQVIDTSSRTSSALIPSYVQDELTWYEEQIAKYRTGELDETKMQKVRLQFGTYAQRQEGVQMQRIKIPAAYLTADQLERLADASDRFGSAFIHFTTREDAQIYYVSLDETPTLLRSPAGGGITTREACGNTVRNITACYRAGTSATEAFDVRPYAESMFQYLVRNKLNQNLGRKFKIAFEGCAEDHSGLRIHDIGLWARVKDGQRGFKVFLGGGLGADPHLASLYSEFLPAGELFNLVAATLRLFDRYGERTASTEARMQFLIETMGWDNFRLALDDERRRVGPVQVVGAALDGRPVVDEGLPVKSGETGRGRTLSQRTGEIETWLDDSVIDDKDSHYRGVHLRIKLGDLTSDRARKLAEVVRRFSASQLRISIEQNIYLPWVREKSLPDLYTALTEISLADRGVGTVSDVTTCPGSDTCRLGIASAKGLGSALSDSFQDGALRKYQELARPLKIKISGCPNG